VQLFSGPWAGRIEKEKSALGPLMGGPLMG